MTRRATLRASDAEREQVAERLRHAAMEGRLLPEELEERVGVALSARTYGELDALVSDLPVPLPSRRRTTPEAARPRPLVAIVLVLVALSVVTSAAGAVIGGHGQDAHAWGGAPIVWLVWIALAWRYYTRRRNGAR
ncbi:MAG TPA: DUF1707 domain-containing protein [Solirubrobacteraceae bacterium]|nr:DUF1707 domain-containing protein [Solirubrobacteraceae bacterium]